MLPSAARGWRMPAQRGTRSSSTSTCKETFVRRESARAGVGIVLYAAGGVLGYLVGPPVALVVFLALPAFYGLTSHGLDTLPIVRRRA